MAVYSMTGYANAASEPPLSAAATAPSVTVEARSVNGRFLDLSLRLPDEYRGLEPALRELVTGAFKRGKIELRVATARDGDSGVAPPTAEQLMRLAHVQSAVHTWLPDARLLSVDEVLNWCRGAGASAAADAPVLDAARRCVDGLREARAREGNRLKAMLLDRVKRLRELAAQAEPLVPQVVQRQQARFVERYTEALTVAQGDAAPDAALAERAHERALTEAAAYAIRIDVAEELTRLASHLDEVERLLSKGGELGKRLEFLIQELQREANTLGSKSAALELTSIAVEMKVAVEQMREQVQNLE